MVKLDLVNFVKERIYKNGVRAINGDIHQSVLLKVVDELYERAPQVDLYSTEEQLTGETYNGKPVYCKRINYGSIEKNYDNIIVEITGATKVWVDPMLTTAIMNGSKIQPLLCHYSFIDKSAPLWINTYVDDTGGFSFYTNSIPLTSLSFFVKYTK